MNKISFLNDDFRFALFSKARRFIFFLIRKINSIKDIITNNNLLHGGGMAYGS